ncbi:hypothetical protein GWI33_003111 [Rhynchophorus ferrugineus]|uniref:Farnesoic acid o-methyltransferase-like protein n=1 Tax=Rhynchophorus ferrugineus TaxID=354439 RepID=A0A834IJM4_RHYFE|nr:hypothetical protein GWI33_003111 [Rhynchophorus ferrugineus]
MSGYYWAESTVHGPFPTSAVLGGHDSDGNTIYVGRAFVQGDWIPAKIIPGRKCAYAAYAGKEVPKSTYQVLCEERFEWVSSSDGQVPLDAVVGGKTSSGENLYIGRAPYSGSITVGKVHPSHRTCYISYGGKEISMKKYEVLVRRR